MRYLALDGNSIVNRAFYGIKLLTTKDGQYTNAIYGFLNILIKLEQDLNPDCTVITFDLKGKTFRHNMYADYKGTRKGMPEELAAQLPVLKQLLADMGYTILTKEGFEADDILGTIAKSCSARGDECYIATGDRDSLQLVDGNVKVALASTFMGKSSTQIMDIAAVEEKYGLTPDKLIDLKALMGDTSDNIPGVKGVGEKTAVGLLQKFSSLEGIYENIDDPFIKKGVREKLTNDKEMAFLSRTLGTIKCDVEVPTECENLAKKPADLAKAEKTLRQLEMFSLAERLIGLHADENGVQIKPEKVLEKADIKPFDNSLDKAIIYKNGDKFIVMWDKSVYSSEPGDSLLREFLEAENKEKIAFDCKSLYYYCIENDIDIKNVSFCMTLAAYLENPSAQGYDFERISAAADAQPAFECEDSFAPLATAVYEYMHTFIEKENQQQLLYEIEMPLAKVLSGMEYEGFGIDRTALEDFGTMLRQRIADELNNIYLRVGHEFNVNSPKQLGAVLFDELGFPAGKKTKTGYSTNADILEGLLKYDDMGVIASILDYRTYQKLNSTYVEGLKDKIAPDGRIHTVFKQTEARTGRISSAEPNMQNIPVRTKLGSELRKFFVAKEGCVLVDTDYSQIELRILAHISDDKTMQEAFINDEDIHTQTAAKVLGLPAEMITPQLRSRAKAINFGIVYGMGAFRLSQDLKIPMKEASDFIKNYKETFSGVAAYMENIVAFAKEKSYVSTLYNRKRIIPEINNSNKVVQENGKRIAMNTPIQGTSADIIKIAMVRVAGRLKEEGLKSRLILQVHDELIVEAPADEAEKAKEILTQEMQNAAQLSVPLKVDAHTGENWYVAKG